MESGRIILAALPQSDGQVKLRPALVLKKVPPFNDLLVCGISSQLHQRVQNLDDIIGSGDSDFSSSGLMKSSLIRIAYLSIIPKHIVGGAIGKISETRLLALKKILSEFILS